MMKKILNLILDFFDKNNDTAMAKKIKDFAREYIKKMQK